MRKLLQLGSRAGFFQLGNDLFGLFLGDSFLQGLRSGIDHLLGFLQAQAGQGTDNLDDGDLVGAAFLQDDVELGLFFLGSSSTGSGSGDSSGSGGNAELSFQSMIPPIL